MEAETTTLNNKSLLLYQNIILVLIFLIPFLITGPQLLTGTLVNCLLILGAKFINKKNHLIIAILPSVATIINGLIFGKFTLFLIFFLPFIWIGNFIFIRSTIYFNNYLTIYLSILLGLIIKTFILYFSAVFYYKFNLVPEIFMTSMGIFQLMTGIMGGLVFLSVNKIIKSQ